MEDIGELIVEAWKRVWPSLEKDPGELARRLARRRSKGFNCPPREWCLAIRAGDRRITAWDVRLEPALRLARARSGQAGHEFRFEECVPHRVHVTGELLVKLNRPVEVVRGGVEHHELAEMLGCDSDSLRCARATGRLRSEYIAGLGGKHGPAIPVLHAERAIDPSRRGKEMGAAVWGSIGVVIWREDRRRKLERFIQVVERVPVWRGKEGSGFRVQGSGGKKKYSYRVPKAAPDYVWYKWRGDEYVGYDWRSERARKGWEKAQERKRRNREGKRRRARERNGRRTPPHSALSQGERVRFGGWAWVCPGCRKTATTLYYPVHAVRALDLLGETDGSARLDEVDAYAQPAGTLACKKCHGVKFFSTMQSSAWSALVMHLSAGLLYGREVEKPKWWKKERKNEFAPRLNARPARRREEVRERILMGWERGRIAKDLGMKVDTVRVHTREILRQARVKSVGELVEAQRDGAKSEGELEVGAITST